MKTKKLIISVLFLKGFLFSQNAIADHVLPVFSGAWYTDAQLQYFDSCGQAAFSYTNKLSTTPIALAQQVLGEVPARTDCRWHEAKLTNVNAISPPDFPGRQQDWVDVLAHANSQPSFKAQRDCVSPDGKVLDSKVSYIYPGYVCPSFSRYGIDRNKQGEGCTTMPVVCNADVVGRELAIYGGHWLGHVGMTRGFDTNQVYNQVVEIFKQPTDEIKVSLSPIDSFKSMPGAAFWGEKFGIQDKPVITDDEAMKILDAGMAQMNYPFTYTLTWDYHPGGSDVQYVFNEETQAWDQVYTVREAKFRCDTFVYYSYVTGANLRIIPEYKFPWVPKDMLAVMASCRDPEGTVCAVNSELQNVQTPLQTVQLAAVFAAKALDIKSADAATKQLVTSTHVSRQAKINQLWSLALRYRNDPIKFGYLLDCLASLRPVELTSELIDAFKQQENKQDRYRLLSVLVASIQVKNESDIERVKNQVANVTKIQHFLHDLLFQNADVTMQKFLIQMYPTVVPAERAHEDISQVLNKHGLSASLLSVRAKKMLELHAAFSTAEQQRQQLPDLISQYTEGDQADLWKQTLCFVLNDMSPTWIDDSVRKLLADVLVTNKLALMGLAASVQAVDMPRCNWLGAYATLMTHSDAEKRRFILNYIYNENDVFAQAQMLAQLPEQLKKQVPASDKAYYRSRFIKQLNSKALLSGTNKRVMMEGISSVYDR